MNTQHIRATSIETAQRLGIDVLPWLPLIDAEVEMRALEEVSSRLLAMNVVAATAYGFDRTRGIAWLEQEALIGALTEPERRFVFESVGEPTRFKLQIEGMWALAWASGRTTELDFTRPCDNTFATLLPNL